MTNMRTSFVKRISEVPSKLLVAMPAISIRCVLFGASLVLLFQTSHAQEYRGTQQNRVTLYEACDYQGKSRTVSLGDYRKMRDIDFGNDKLSSILVPRGVTVTIFEHDKFRGDSVRIIRDISCFDGRWNDRVSSFKVALDNASVYSPNQGSRGDVDRNSNNRTNQNTNRNTNPAYGNDGIRVDPNARRTAASRNGSRQNDVSVTGNNVTQVVFNNRILQQTSSNEWLLSGSRSGSIKFQLVDRDDNLVLLRNDFTAQRIRIDMFANDVTVVNPNSQPVRFNISSAQSSLSDASTSRGPSSQLPNRLIDGPCFNYKAFTNGGAGGIRFHGHDGFNRFDRKAYQGRICDSGELTMEINKTDLNTDVFIQIQGRTFRFAADEKADVFRNTWHRKLVTLVVR